MMKAGFRKLDITPSIDIQGSYRLSPTGRALGIHDPIYGRWMVLESSETYFSILSMDLVGLSSCMVGEWKEYFGMVSGLSKNQILIACTHTHNSVDLLNEWGEYDSFWEKELREKLGIELKKALESMVQVKLGWGEVNYEKAINRHEWALQRGHVPIDPQVSILRVDDMQNRSLGHVIHYTGHPTTAMADGFLISADYPGVLLRHTENKLGGIGIFLQGAAGNINLEMGERRYEHAEHHGKELADLIIPKFSQISLSSDSHLKTSHCLTLYGDFFKDREDPVVLQRNYELLLEEFKKSKEKDLWSKATTSLWDQTRVLRLKLDFEKNRKHTEKMSMDVQWMMFNERFLLFMPGEWFVEYGLMLKRDFLEKKPLWVGYCHGYIGYIPTQKASREKGSYVERIKGFRNDLEPGEGERIYRLIANEIQKREF